MMTFLLRDLLLAMVAGVLFGVLIGRRGPAKERPVARALSLVLEPIVYWADLRGPDGRPSHSKIAYFLGLVVALYGLVAFGKQQGGDLEIGFIMYAAVVLSYALGKQVFNTVLKWIVARFPGAEIRVHRLSNGGMQTPAEPEIPPGGGKAMGDVGRGHSE